VTAVTTKESSFFHPRENLKNKIPLKQFRYMMAYTYDMAEFRKNMSCAGHIATLRIILKQLLE
jgi:hypothetical protein